MQDSLDQQTAALFAATDFRERARLLWGAARVNITALARSRGLPCETTRRLMRRVA